MHSERVRVLYIGGLGRSGSTLIERLIGRLPGACPAGELVHLWDRGIAGGERCGCGTPFRQCPFWQQVGTAAFGGWDRVDVGRVAALRARIDRTRYVPALAGRALGPQARQALDEYTSYFARLYTAIAGVSGCGLVVDSSKHASLAHCLRGHPGVDLRVLHVVRDSRAVAYSWSRRVRRPDTETRSYMTTYSPFTAAAQWNAQNAALHVLAWAGCPTLRIRYEDFVAGPGAALHRVAEFAGLPVRPPFPFLADGTGSCWADLGAAHTVSGNPVRFARGMTPVRRDDRWRTAMPAVHRRAVTACTWPLLAGYGYLRAAS